MRYKIWSKEYSCFVNSLGYPEEEGYLNEFFVDCGGSVNLLKIPLNKEDKCTQLDYLEKYQDLFVVCRSTECYDLNKNLIYENDLLWIPNEGVRKVVYLFGQFALDETHYPLSEYIDDNLEVGDYSSRVKVIGNAFNTEFILDKTDLMLDN